MTNGQVFIGALDGFGTTTPMLRDVHYVRTVPGKTAADPNEHHAGQARSRVAFTEHDVSESRSHRARRACHAHFESRCADCTVAPSIARSLAAQAHVNAGDSGVGLSAQLRPLLTCSPRLSANVDFGILPRTFRGWAAALLPVARRSSPAAVQRTQQISMTSSQAVHRRASVRGRQKRSPKSVRSSLKTKSCIITSSADEKPLHWRVRGVMTPPTPAKRTSLVPKRPRRRVSFTWLTGWSWSIKETDASQVLPTRTTEPILVEPKAWQAQLLTSVRSSWFSSVSRFASSR